MVAVVVVVIVVILVVAIDQGGGGCFPPLGSFSLGESSVVSGAKLAELVDKMEVGECGLSGEVATSIPSMARWSF